jgi:hypothetical protein
MEQQQDKFAINNESMLKTLKELYVKEEELKQKITLLLKELAYIDKSKKLLQDAIFYYNKNIEVNKH